MDFSDVISKRLSVRSFKNIEVAQDIIDEILESAILAPSAGNRQPCRYKVIRNVSLKNEIMDSFLISMPWFLQASVVIAVIIDSIETAKRYAERGEKLYSILDAGAAIENILLSATNKGIGSCWIGAFDEDKLNSILNVSSPCRVVSLIALGYQDGQINERPRRKTKDEIVDYLD